MYCGEDDVAAFVQTTTANPTTLPSSPETLLSAVSYNLQHRSPASSLRLLPGRLQTDLYSCCSSGRSLLCLRSKGRRIPVNLSSPTHLTNHFCFLTSSSITSVPYMIVPRSYSYCTILSQLLISLLQEDQNFAGGGKFFTIDVHVCGCVVKIMIIQFFSSTTIHLTINFASFPSAT